MGIAWKSIGQKRDGETFAVSVGNVQLFKSQTAAPDRSMRIAGLISTDSLDLDGERILQDGLDFSQFLSNGYFNDDHDKSVVLGRPEMVKYLRKGQRMPCGLQAFKDGWYVEGYLLHTPRVINPDNGIWTLAKSSNVMQPTLGFSLEGLFRACDRVNGVIRRAMVRNVAITDQPTNPDTALVAFAKSLAGRTAAGSESPGGGNEALLSQSLEDSATIATGDSLKEKGMNGKTDIAALVAGVKELEKSVKKIADREGLAADAGLAGLAGGGEVDGEQLVKSLVARSEKVLGDAHADIASLAQLSGATVGLVKSQNDRIVALEAQNGELKELLKSVSGKLDTLLGQPAGPARGATGGANGGAGEGTGGSAQTRQFGNGGGAQDKFGTVELQKSLNAKIDKAMKANDRGAVDRLARLQSRVETGSVGKDIAAEIEAINIAG